MFIVRFQTNHENTVGVACKPVAALLDETQQHFTPTEFPVWGWRFSINISSLAGLAQSLCNQESGEIDHDRQNHLTL